ncbi:MAG: ATP-dependent zinc protease [Coraliomargarita sp.]
MQLPQRLKLLLLLPIFCLSAATVLAQSDAAEEQILIVGETEYIYIKDSGYAYDSRIDTGATTCSIHAEEITPFERDGESWVKFKLVNFNNKERIELERRIARVAQIKRHGFDSQERYVVKLTVVIDNKEAKVEFSLADRTNYTYPLLVGRNLLRGQAIVDVNQSYMLGKRRSRVTPK